MARDSLSYKDNPPRYHQMCIRDRLLTKKTADFVCGEPPVIDAGDRTDALQDALDAMEFSNVL